MSFTPLDFQYDEKDVSKIKVAFDELKVDERKGYYVGLATWAGSYFVYSKIINKKYGIQILASFVTGVISYNLYTHKSRAYYNLIASKVNTNAANKLNLSMNYPAPEYKDDKFEYK